MFYWLSGTRSGILILFTVTFLSMLGCGVSQDDFEKVVKQRDALEQEIGEAKARYESQKHELEAIKKEMDALKKINMGLEKSTRVLNERVKAYKKLLRENAPTVSLQEVERVEAPVLQGEYREYEVKEGDSLWSIARENGLTVNSIKEANNLEGNKIKLGQKLKIPVKGE